MDLSQAAFGLDMRAASRVYFINPVLNPQIENQAIARVRRISQEKAVSVETLVLKDSIDEVILERRDHMTQAEHGKAKTILDVTSINNWIRNARIVPVDDPGDAVAAQMVTLATPLPILGNGYGRSADSSDGLVNERPKIVNSTSPRRAATPNPIPTPPTPNGQKRVRDENEAHVTLAIDGTHIEAMVSRPAQRVRFTVG